ncbi:hypothetical protein vseg_017366 [Gypsophila vaccaria]
MDTPTPLRRRSIVVTESESESESEFEFWSSNLQPLLHTPLHSADQLFSHGILLPLHSLPEPGSTKAEPGSSEPGSSEPSALIASSSNPILTASKRWREIFKKKVVSNNDDVDNDCEKVDKKREKNRKNGHGHGPGSAELNINIWPFSRSRSAGSNKNRSCKPALLNRKASSAPCSRSNSSGESKTSRRSWPGSPSRPGVHVGRASPVWHARRAGPGGRASAGCEAARRGKVLNFNVPVCGVSNFLVGGGGGGRGGGNGNLFGLRGLFGKKSNGTAVLTA